MKTFCSRVMFLVALSAISDTIVFCDDCRDKCRVEDESLKSINTTVITLGGIEEVARTNVQLLQAACDDYVALNDCTQRQCQTKAMSDSAWETQCQALLTTQPPTQSSGTTEVPCAKNCGRESLALTASAFQVGLKGGMLWVSQHDPALCRAACRDYHNMVECAERECQKKVETYAEWDVICGAPMLPLMGVWSLVAFATLSLLFESNVRL
ncbi:hypothetical protein DdX_17362 [Ditylenchus destructor]|uniref:Uncharacterized protein n=1 Tax=Ditylenchus destructor TaxID=166010 RepID=A0AAD4QTH0_9BILA|nr:hypothetical protein DdX_17362 [Ditylenchus destructor]